MLVMCHFQTFHFAPQPNESFNADANTGHAFGIFMASVGALRPDGLRRRLTRALGFMKISIDTRRHVIVASVFFAVITASLLIVYLIRLLPSIEEKCAKQCHTPIMEGHMVHILSAAMTAGMSGKGPMECRCFQPGTYNPLSR
jgi:hypothetical protein